MDLEIKTVLITGGTGFIGKALCAHLIKLGFRVYVLTRMRISSQSNHNKGITYVNTLNALGDVAINVIINLAGETISKRWTKRVKENIYNSRILTTRNIVDYIKSLQQRPSVLISGSAVGYYGTDPQKVFDEEAYPSNMKEGFAQHLCKSWEEEAKQAETLGVRVVLLRIGPVLEKEGGMLSKLLPSFYLGLGGTIGNGTQWLSWIDRDDLISLIIFIISHSKIHGPVNATAPHPVSYAQFASSVAKSIRRPCLLKMPGFLLKIIFGQMAEEIMLQGQQVLPRKALQHGFEFRYPMIEESLKKIFN